MLVVKHRRLLDPQNLDPSKLSSGEKALYDAITNKDATGTLTVVGNDQSFDFEKSTGKGANSLDRSDLNALNAPTEMSLGVTVGWWSAEEFIQQLQATAAKGAVTSANFVKTIHAGWTIKPLPGGISGLTFPDDQTKPASCGGLMQSDAKGHYTVREKYQCNPSDTVKVSDG